MRKPDFPRVAGIALLLIFSVSLGGCTRVYLQGEGARRMAVEQAVEGVKPALVRIHVVEANYNGGRAWKRQVSGSGVIISPDGTIVTNHHVAGDSVRLVCTLANQEEVPADLIGTDAMSDIAVIRLKPAKPREFPHARWGNSDQLRVGDPVLAMGSPLALSQSVTEGIVSNTALVMPRGGWDFRLDGEDVGSIVRWIAHDAAIYPGNSGGPLVSLGGEVIGINEISLGLGGAIPGNLAREVAEKILQDGEVGRAFLGLMVQPIFKSEREKEGALVSDVVKDSPAAGADIRPGDRLLAIEGAGEPYPVHVRFREELPPLNLYLASLPIDQPVKLKLERDGETITREVKPVKREKVLPRNREYKPWGLTGRDLSIWTAIEMKRETTDGVLVTSVRPGGPVGQARPPLQDADIITRVAGEPVRNMDALSELTERLVGDSEETVPLLVEFARRGEQMLTVVNVGLKELDDPGRVVQKAWLPVATQVLTPDLREKLELGERTGVRVTQLYEPEESGLGLKVGDLIVELDGKPIPASEPHDTEVFPTLLRQYKIGAEAELTLLRVGKEERLKVQLPGRPEQPRELKQYQDFDFEFTVRELAYQDRVDKQLEESVTGVLVESVQDGGWAALGELNTGDVLLEIDGEAVNEVEAVRSKMEAIKQSKQPQVVFRVRRGVHSLFIELEAVWEKEG